MVILAVATPDWAVTQKLPVRCRPSRPAHGRGWARRAGCSNSKHNIQYLFGGYRFFFFDDFDAIGVSRYLPISSMSKARRSDRPISGNGMESYEKGPRQVLDPVLPDQREQPGIAARARRRYIRKLGPKREARRNRSARSCPPTRRSSCAQRACRAPRSSEAHSAARTAAGAQDPRGAGLLRTASERRGRFHAGGDRLHGPGATKLELVEALRREEVNRGLTFEYCLITAGTSLNRAPSEQVWGAGDILSLDSGGDYKGYIGDLCRMGDPGRARRRTRRPARRNGRD